MSRAQFLKVAGATGAVVTASGAVLSVVGDTAWAQDAETEGEFGPLFVEPWIYFPTYYKKRNSNGTRVRTNEECISPPGENTERVFCKPAAGQSGVMPDGTYLYINALEGTEDSEMFGFDSNRAAEDSQSRVLKINYSDHTKSEFIKPKRNTGVSPPEQHSELVPGTPIADRGGNDGDMFCSHQCHLPGGSYLVVGGTNWYGEPGIPAPAPPNTGVVELEGNSRSRYFDWKKNNWYRTGDLIIGRWYPAVVPTQDGTPYVFGGVHKLEKPVYDGTEPGEPPAYESGGNIAFAEYLDLKKGKYRPVGPPPDTEHPETLADPSRRSLPLQPRLKLLPNNHISFTGVGQAFSPNGQDYRQASWNMAASFDVENEAWTEHGIAGQGCVKPFNVGSKLSCAEVPLTMEPDANGNYTSIELLSGGGTWGGVLATNPGNYFANNQSRIVKWTVAEDGSITQEGRDTGDMFSPGTNPENPALSLGRWFGDMAILPNGEVFVSGGADRDEVIFPGAEFPILECEIFNMNDTTDSPNGSWRVVGAIPEPGRTYHNTNATLPTGQVIIGGHAPIPFGYVSHDDDVLPETRNSDGRDPTFQIYTPEFAMAGSGRPVINTEGLGPNGTKKALTAVTGGVLTIPTKSSGKRIDDVVISRLSSGTHVNDVERRLLKLDVTTKKDSVRAKMPKTLAELGGPGYYIAFIREEDGALPSEGVFVHVKK